MRPLRWAGRAREDLRAFPGHVRREIGFALYFAQCGDKHPSAKPLKGFSGAGVLEIVEDHDGNAYRAVYTVRLARATYLLHAFQKKSKTGIATPKLVLDLIRDRLKWAERDARERKA
jgi:phage-related protein